jgi:trimethyllysine dioxygenase
MDISSTKGLADWMIKTVCPCPTPFKFPPNDYKRLYGFCFVNNTPPTPEATESLLNRIGPIRNTHYGGFWDFTSNMAFADTAYTDEALDVHTDTSYFSDSTGLQMFHLLEHDGTGGGSQIVDGFQCAQNLRKQNREHYDSLARTRMFFHASGNEGLSIQPHTPFPVLVHDETTGDLVQIRWNPYDKAAFAVSARAQPEQLEQWYQAARGWNKLLQQDEPSVRDEVQLKPGRPLR